MRRLLSLASLTLCLFAAPLAAQKQPERKSISVVMPVPKAEAFGRTMAAFVEEGLVVTESSESGGVITVGPFIPNKYAMVEAEVVYRANIIATDSTSRVTLSGTMKASGLSGSTPSPITSKFKGEGGKAWKQLERIAAALGGQVAEPAAS